MGMSGGQRQPLGLLFLVVALVTLMGAAWPVCAEKQVTLTWYVIRTEAELPYWQEMADRFMERNKELMVNVMNELSGGVAKLTTMIAAGVAPDIVRGETNWMPDYAGKGWFVNLEPYVARDRAQLKLQEFPKPTLDAFMLDGLQYAIPQVVSGLAYNYNTAMFENAGVSAPEAGWAWADLVNVSKRLTREDADGRITQYGLSLGRSIHHDIYAFMLQNGGDHFTADRREILIDRPESVEAIDFAQSLVNQHRVAGWGADFVAGKAAAQIIGPWRRGHHNTVKELQWDVAPLPRQKQAITPLYVGGLAILAESKNHEDAWELVKYLTGTEAQHIWAKNGQSCPARLPVAGSASFLKAGPPAHAMVYVDSINRGVPEPSFPGWPDIRAAIDRVLGSVWNGQTPARVAAEQAKAVAQPMLDELNKAR
jgi:multiple sugar transport system substrate-binding protein